jgi:adenosine deaminase
VDDEWVRGLPKAEVHVHVEGCVPFHLLDRGEQELPPPLPVTDLAGLLSYLDWSCGQIASASQLEEISYGIARRAVSNGAGHCDVIVNPTHWPHWPGRQGLVAMIDALDAGFRAGEQDTGVTATLCVSLKRTQSRAEALQVVDALLELGHPRVSALSIDGNEANGAGSHNERFAPAFERAASGGLHRCAHAGESSGPAGVREAIELLGAERIDHGVRAVEDDAVVELLVETGTPLDVCPTSNVVLGVAESLASHPVAALRSRGVRCSLNTDDPLIYGVDLAHEYTAVAGAFEWGRNELAEMARTSIESSFATEERKRELLSQLAAYPTG